jgi:hypothetical protein
MTTKPTLQRYLKECCIQNRNINAIMKAEERINE